MKQPFVDTLVALAGADPRVMLLTADLGFNALEPFAEAFPEQYLNVGVAEQNMTGVATGLALGGRTVFTYSIGNFPTLRCLEQIRNDAAYHDANVNICAMGGGFSYGSLGMSHHATEDLAILRALPITVVAPGDCWEAAMAIRAVARRSGVAYLRLERGGEPTQLGGGTFRLGEARQVAEGADATIFATGTVLEEAFKAAELLRSEGIHTGVYSFHTLRPFDSETVLRCARQSAGIVTVEEHGLIGGLGSATADALAENGARPGFFRKLGIRDGFSSIVGTQAYLRRHFGLDAPAIAAVIRDRLASPVGSR